MSTLYGLVSLHSIFVLSYALGGEGRKSLRAGGRHHGGAVESLVMCSTGVVGVDDDDHEKEGNDEERIEIGQPTDVPHVSHITYVFLLVFYQHIIYS